MSISPGTAAVQPEHNHGDAWEGPECSDPDPRAAWAARSDELARWTWERMVNRSDVWGGYRNEADRRKEYVKPDGTKGKLGKTTTRPSPSKRGKVLLGEANLVQHYAATRPAHIVGLHTTSAQNTSLWGATEIDWHGPDSTGPEINVAAAIGWHRKLAALGFSPLLTDSNGAGGYHLRAIFNAPVATPTVYVFLKWLVKDHAQYGLPSAPEIFPKQPRIAAGKIGNWLRLPGRHHTKNHWSQVWDGQRWLDGAAAVDFILSLKGDSPVLIPAEAVSLDPKTSPTRNGATHTHTPHSDALSRRITAYMAHVPNLHEGAGRDNIAYNFAAWLVRDMQLGDDEALLWLCQWDQNNGPPKGEERLREIVKNAHTYGQHEYGVGLDDGRAPRYGRRQTTSRSAEGEHGQTAGDGHESRSEIHLTDTGNGKRLVERHGDDLRHCHPWGKWLAWDGSRWQQDATAEATRRAKETITSLYFWAVNKAAEIGRQLEGMTNDDQS